MTDVSFKILGNMPPELPLEKPLEKNATRKNLP